LGLESVNLSPEANDILFRLGKADAHLDKAAQSNEIFFCNTTRESGEGKVVAAASREACAPKMMRPTSRSMRGYRDTLLRLRILHSDLKKFLGRRNIFRRHKQICIF
jgi:hypothetical protein